jgi:hypothetical protein
LPMQGPVELGQQLRLSRVILEKLGQLVLLHTGFRDGFCDCRPRKARKSSLKVF